MTYDLPNQSVINNLDTYSNKASPAPSGDSLIAFITNELKVPCELIKVTASPQAIYYHINLHSALDLSKLRRLLANISYKLNNTTTLEPSSLSDAKLVINRTVKQVIAFKDVIVSEQFITNLKPGAIALGVDLHNNPVIKNLYKLPHLLIAGASGSGKSVMLNSIICSLIMSAAPSQLKMVLIDPKRVELQLYDGLPHLLAPIITTAKKALETLKSLCVLMDKRYQEMSLNGFKHVDQAGYAHIVVVVDELADLMLSSKLLIETYLIRLSQMGRAAGIHLILATQRPTVKVVTGLIKANINAKIALKTANIRDAVNIMDHKGAEALTGSGDAWLKLPDTVEELRIQSPYISDNDIIKITNFWRIKK